MSDFLSPVEIAQSICTLNGDTNFSRIGRVLTAVGRAAYDVYKGVIPQVKSTFVRIQDNLTAPLPCGAVDVVKVGVVNNHGQIIHLYEEKLLRRGLYNSLLKKAANCDTTAEAIQNSIITQNKAQDYYPGDYFHNCVNNTGNFGEMYGWRFDPGTIGTWRAVPEQGYIEFGSGAFIASGRYIIIEYKDSSDSRLAFLPHEAFGAIEARTRYYLNAGTSAGMVASRDFQREYGQLKRMLLRKDVLDYLRAIGDHKRSPSALVTSSGLSIPSSTSTSNTITTITEPALSYFTGDDTAMLSGLVHGDKYLLAEDNDYDLPEGLVKTVYDA